MKRRAIFFMAAVTLLTNSPANEPPSPLDYTYGFWSQSCRRPADKASANILNIETGRYGLQWNIQNPRELRFGPLHEKLGYRQAGESGLERLRDLPPAELTAELRISDRVYQMTSSRTGLESNTETALANVWLWESARIAQHYEMRETRFEDAQGNPLPAFATMSLVAWPENLTFTLDIRPDFDWENGPAQSHKENGVTDRATIFKKPDQLAPSRDWVFKKTFDDAPPAPQPVFRDAMLSLRLKTADGEWHSERTVAGDWTFPHAERISLTCAPPEALQLKNAFSVQVLASGNQTVPTAFDSKFHCFLARANFSRSVPRADRLKRSAKNEKTGFGNYDDFLIKIENSSVSHGTVPFLLDLVGPASVAGLVAILCEPDGTPSGIPVQVSKNWHHGPMGHYLRAYALLPAATGKTSYLLRVAYGFYGTLPTASLSQLSLAGSADSANARRDHWAIGSWGGTFCLNPEFSRRISPITDIRALFIRDGKEGKPWLWSDGDLGADWFSVKDASGQTLTTARMKASYLSHGPCLPEIVYHGSYGVNGEVDLTAEVSTPRTDDHSKILLRLRYDFRSELPAEDSYFFRLGCGKAFSPKIAFGNREGLIRELDAPVGLTADDTVLDGEAFSGPAPWWLGFPGSKVPGVPSGSLGFVIRSYRATLGGKTFDTPSLSLLVGATGKFARTDHVDAVIVPPTEIQKFQPGDSVELEIELDVVPVHADDYQGPNEDFLKHLTASPASWKTFHRAATANDLRIEVQGGTLLRKLPIVIQADPAAKTIQLKIQGGAGTVPVRFEGLESAKGYELGQLVSGTKLMNEYLPVMKEFAPSIANRLEPRTLPLDQGFQGNDYWETSLEPETKTYTRTYNLPLDGKTESIWILKQRTSK